MHLPLHHTMARLLTVASVLLGLAVQNDAVMAQAVKAQEKSDGPPRDATTDKAGSPSSFAASSQPMRIQHGDNLLAGVLYLPKGPGPHPAVIFIHGDGPADHTAGGSFRPIWQRFLEAGFACLAWDKPGIGGSKNPSGQYQRQSYFQRAAELRWAIDFLKARPEIDPRRIGCWGISQAGWIMPLVASRSTDIVFIIAVSCPGQTATQQGEYLLRCRMLDQGAAAKQAASAAQLAGGLAFILPAPQPPDEFWQHLAGSNPDYVYPGANRGPESDGSLLIDPIPYLEQTKCPVLAIFGSNDRNVDPVASAAAYERALRTGGNQRVTIKTFPGATHSLFMHKARADGQGGDWYGRTFAPGYLDTMTNWLINLPAAKSAQE